MSTLNVANITDGSTTVGTEYVVNGSVKAWVNLNGTGTVSVRNSFNVSSVTDAGVGYYRPIFTSAMNGEGYVCSGFMEYGNISPHAADMYGNPLSSTVFNLICIVPYSALYDTQIVQGSVMGDLA